MIQALLIIGIVQATLKINKEGTNSFLVKDFPHGQVVHLYFQDTDAFIITLTITSQAVAFGVQVKGTNSMDELIYDTDYSGLKSSQEQQVYQVTMVGMKMAGLRLTKLSEVQQGIVQVQVQSISFSMVVILLVVLVLFSLLMVLIVNYVLKRRKLKKNIKIKLDEDSEMLSMEG